MNYIFKTIKKVGGNKDNFIRPFETNKIKFKRTRKWVWRWKKSKEIKNKKKQSEDNVIKSVKKLSKLKMKMNQAKTE